MADEGIDLLKFPLLLSLETLQIWIGQLNEQWKGDSFWIYWRISEG